MVVGQTRVDMLWNVEARMELKWWAIAHPRMEMQKDQ